MWHCALYRCDWCDSRRPSQCPRAGACPAIRWDGANPGVMCGRGKHAGNKHKCRWVPDDGSPEIIHTWYQLPDPEPEQEELMADQVNHPSHYTAHPSGVECIAVTRHMSFNLGSAVKYLWRAGLKDGNPTVQDLEKAVWYIRDEIGRLQAEAAKDEEDFS